MKCERGNADLIPSYILCFMIENIAKRIKMKFRTKTTKMQYDREEKNEIDVTLPAENISLNFNEKRTCTHTVRNQNKKKYRSINFTNILYFSRKIKRLINRFIDLGKSPNGNVDAMSWYEQGMPLKSILIWSERPRVKWNYCLIKRL